MTRRFLGDGFLTPTSCEEVLSVSHHLCEIPKDSGMHPAIQTPDVHATQHMSRLPKVRKQRSRKLKTFKANKILNFYIRVQSDVKINFEPLYLQEKKAVDNK